MHLKPIGPVGLVHAPTFQLLPHVRTLLAASQKGEPERLGLVISNDMSSIADAHHTVVQSLAVHPGIERRGTAAHFAQGDQNLFAVDVKIRHVMVLQHPPRQGVCPLHRQDSDDRVIGPHEFGISGRLPNRLLEWLAEIVVLTDFLVSIERPYLVQRDP